MFKKLNWLPFKELVKYKQAATEPHGRGFNH